MPIGDWGRSCQRPRRTPQVARSAGIACAVNVAALIGSPVAHSLSPAIHQAAFDAAGVDWRYVAFDVPAGRADEALAAMRVARHRRAVGHDTAQGAGRRLGGRPGARRGHVAIRQHGRRRGRRSARGTQHRRPGFHRRPACRWCRCVRNARRRDRRRSCGAQHRRRPRSRRGRLRRRVQPNGTQDRRRHRPRSVDGAPGSLGTSRCRHPRRRRADRQRHVRRFRLRRSWPSIRRCCIRNTSSPISSITRSTRRCCAPHVRLERARSTGSACSSTRPPSNSSCGSTISPTSLRCAPQPQSELARRAA